MKIEELKNLLSTEWDSELETLWQSYAAESSESLPEGNAFLSYLYQQGRISFATLEKIYLTQAIEISSAQELQAFQSHRARHFPPEQFYEQENVLGQGAMGIVYRAKDRALLRHVAFKTLLVRREEGATPIVLRRFLHEVQITAQLDHPNIVPIYQLMPHLDGSLSYAMKMVKGKTLKDLIHEAQEAYDAGQIPDDDHSMNTLLEHFLKVCDALDYAHSKRVIHRDLKPANIMVGGYNDVYVMDWGIARRIGVDAEDSDQKLALGSTGGAADDPQDLERTQVGQILGTPRYMSPQQAAGKNDELDGASDQFSLGLILYEILTLKTAMQANQQIELLKKVLKAELPPFQAYHPKRPIPKDLKAVVLKATGRKPHQRYASVGEMARDIRRYQHGEAVSARQEVSWEKALRWMHRHAKGTLLTILSSFLLLCCVIGVSLLIQLKTSEQARKRAQALEKFLSATAAQAQTLDRKFLQIEAQLEGLSAAAQLTLQQKDLARYQIGSTAFAGQDPTHFVSAPAYAQPIAVHWLSRQDSTTPVSAKPTAQEQALSNLRQRLQLIFKENMALTDRSEHDFEQRLQQKGAALVWAHLSLLNNASRVSSELVYPGVQPGVNVPHSPELELLTQRLNATKQARKQIWGTPFASSQGALLPCLEAIHNQEGQTLAIAEFDLRLKAVIEDLFLSDFQAAKEIFLLNAQGQVLLSVPNLHSEQALIPEHPTPFAEKAVAQAFQAEETGYLEREDKVWAFHRLSTLGGYYLVEADAQEVLAQ